MDYFWKENRNYLIALGAGLLGVWIYCSFVLSPLRASADRGAAKLRQEEKAHRQRLMEGVPTEGTLAVARRELDRSRRQLGALASDLVFPVSDRFVKPKGETAGEHYDNLKLELYAELQGKAKGLNGFPPKASLFGLNAAGDEVSEDLARELVLRLAVVQRLVQVAMESGVDRIDAVEALHDVSRKDEPVSLAGAFLNRMAVLMKFAGEAQAVFKVLHGMQKKGSFLAVTGFTMDRKDPTQDYFEATLAVSFLRVDEKASIRPDAGGPGE